MPAFQRQVHASVSMSYMSVCAAERPEKHGVGEQERKAHIACSKLRVTTWSFCSGPMHWASVKVSLLLSGLHTTP